MFNVSVFVSTDHWGVQGWLEPFPARSGVATVTDLLERNVPLEDVQHLAGHGDPCTTRLADRRRKTVTRNIVERISIEPDYLTTPLHSLPRKPHAPK
jgi:hypothetical protein